MSDILTPAVGPQAIYRVNPVAKLAAATVLGVALILSVDWVSATVALAFELALLPFVGIGARRLLLRMSPIVVAAVLAGVTIVLYGRPSGATHFRFLLAQVTDGSIEFGVATALRVLAIAIPGIVLFITIDPTELADGLSQLLHLPSRFVLGALAALRLVGLLLDDWRSLELARRARGVADRGRVRRFIGAAFALLVLSLRRGSKLATAMEARGFGGPTPRSWARASTFGAREVVLIAIGAAIAAVAVGVSVATGHWNFLASQ